MDFLGLILNIKIEESENFFDDKSKFIKDISKMAFKMTLENDPNMGRRINLSCDVKFWQNKFHLTSLSWLLSSKMLIFLATFSAFFCIISSSEIHDEKYFCGSKNVPSTSRILVLSPNDKFLSAFVLQNITGKLQTSENKIGKETKYFSSFQMEN